jgi:hypothetical protein
VPARTTNQPEAAVFNFDKARIFTRMLAGLAAPLTEPSSIPTDLTQTDGAAHWGLNMALRDGTEFKKRPHQLKRIGDGGSLAKTIC